MAGNVLPQGVIEIIHTKKSPRLGSRQLRKDEITITHAAKGGYCVRFSSDLSPELEKMQTASLARNTITGEVYLLLVSTQEGEQPLAVERIADDRVYRVIRGKDFATTLAEVLGLPNDRPSHRIKISHNLANDSKFITYKLLV